MGEKTEDKKFKVLVVGDGEFHLRMEEEMRDCLPCTFLAATAGDGTQYPAVMVDRIKNKKTCMDTIVDSWWILMQDRSKSQKVLFLKLDFRGAGTMKFCLDLSPGILNRDNREELAIWLQYVISSGGKVAVVDGDAPGIVATGIWLDIPKRLLKGEL